MRKKKATSKILIPLGCDCFPAYILKQTNLRRDSFPFDWLSTNSILGVKYIYDNIINNFEFFLKDLRKNDSGQIYSPFYEYSLFFHHNDLIDNPATYSTFVKKCNKFLKYIETKSCGYLYNLKSVELISQYHVNIFKESVNSFQRIMKPGDKLFIYIRYDESYDENRNFCDGLLTELRNFEKVKTAKFNRQKSKFGIWGDQSCYKALLAEIGLHQFIDD